MDEIDRAQAQQSEFNAEALREHQRRQQTGPGASECESCGTDIPAARRMAQPSCTHCIECQTKLEMNFRRHV